MATLPDIFIQPHVPDDKVDEILQLTEEEGEFHVTRKHNTDGTSDLTFRRIGSSGGTQ
jgi:hypothetical protein